MTPHYADESVPLWRCETCRKWSHAKRRPGTHQRFSHEEPPNGYPYSYTFESSGHPDDPGVYVIVCGPFEAWEARRVAAS